MTTSDPRAWLVEVQERASKATEGLWLHADDAPRNILHHQRSQRDGSYIGSASLAAVSTNDEDAEFIAPARIEHPAMAAALLAVLEKADAIEAEGKGKSVEMFARAVADEFRTAITEHLPKENDRG